MRAKRPTEACERAVAAYTDAESAAANPAIYHSIFLNLSIYLSNLSFAYPYNFVRVCVFILLPIGQPVAPFVPLYTSLK